MFGFEGMGLEAGVPSRAWCSRALSNAYATWDYNEGQGCTIALECTSQC